MSIYLKNNPAKFHRFETMELSGFLKRLLQQEEQDE